MSDARNLVRLCAVTSCMLVESAIASLAFAGDPAMGKKMIGRCMACHGLNGIGKSPDVPNLAGESTVYLTNQLNAYRSG